MNDAKNIEQRLSDVFSSFKGEREDLIPILQRIQLEFGYLSDQAMLAIAGFTGMPESRVYAVATFYAQFRFTPVGKNMVTVCRGTACHVKGAPRILEEIEKHLDIEEGETTPDMEYSLETVACIGACGLSPCIMINKEVKAKLTPKKAARLFAGNGENR